MDFDKVGKNTGFFSFTKTIADLAANREFTEGYKDLIQNGDNGGRFNEKSFIWHSLSAISEMVGTTIYENVLNYIDNVSNIDTCKVRALASMSDILGITNNGIRETIDKMPPDVLRFLDVFSINKSYLASPTLLRSELLFDIVQKVNADGKFRKVLEDAKRHAVNSLSGVPSADITVFGGFPEDVYREFVFDAFYDLLSSKIYLTYDGKPLEEQHAENFTSSDNDYSVYSNLVKRYKNEEHSIYKDETNRYARNLNDPYCFYDSIDLDSSWREQIDSLKNIYGLRNFDPFKVADDIYNGEDSLDNYYGSKLYIVQQVFKNRNAQKFSNDPLTKFAYYTEKTVVDYLHYVNTQYLFRKTGSYDILSSSEIYNVDQNYMELDKYHLSNHWITDTIIDPSGLDPKIRNEVIKSVANILTDMCFAIVDIREKLKTQSQRNYMRGTFLLISYVVSEYLKKNLSMQYPELRSYLSNYYYRLPGNEEWAVDIIEYIDTTEYYNLSTDTSQYALYGKTVNMPFWLDEDEGIAGKGIALQDIERFYLSTLNIKTVASTTSAFLDVIYELGADRGYIDKRTSSDIIVGAVQDNLQEDVDKGLMTQADFNAISSYQREIFLNYNGTKIGFDPYYNWKNLAHPSYQIHPYLPRFIERTSITNAIKNNFITEANSELMIALHTPEISTILGDVGQILNIWDRNAQTFHGWRTRYEKNTHDQITNYGRISPLQHYDGVFYPSAIEDYVAAARSEELCASTAFEELIYSVANLSSGKNVANYYNHQILLCNDYDFSHYDLGLFENTFNYASTLICLDLSLQTELSKDDPDKIIAHRLSTEIQQLTHEGPERTFYDKWYSHLDLQKIDCTKIAMQLSTFKEDILDLYSETSKDAPTYDIYKYGLDKYSNSYLLYKKYPLDTPYLDKRDVKGEMWFRFNSHPIGFPLFVGSPYIANQGYLSNVSQVDTENMDRNFAYFLSAYPYLRLTNCFYDFDFTNDYRALVLAYDDTDADVGDYTKIKKFLIAKPYEKPSTYDEYGNRLLDFQLKTYTNSIGHYYTEEFLNDYDFQGFFQDEMYVQGIWSNVNGDQIDLARVRFPDEDYSTRARFTTYLSARNDLNYCLNFTTTIADPKIRVGYANEIYTIAALTETESQHISSMTYVGANTHITSNDTSLDSIMNDVYGRNIEYFLSANDIPDENNSIDRLEHYLTLASFSDKYFEGNAGNPPFGNKFIIAKNYNLNPDASYIPLYSGLLGFSRIWAVDFYKQKKLQSIELLGYSFNAMKKLIEDFSDNIVVDDDTGISSNIDLKMLLNGVFRVYEQYNNGREFFLAVYNDILYQNEDHNYEWTISLSNLQGLGTDGSDYKVQFYNVLKGAQCPILMCDLTALTSSVQYLSSGTVADNYYLSNNYMLPNVEDVVGTPNIFEYSFDPNFASGRSNYIMNVMKITPVATYDGNEKNITMTFHTQYQDRDYIIDRGSLLAIIYKPNLHWLENYHMLVPHDIWPYLSVDNKVYDPNYPGKIKVEGKDYLSTVISDYVSFAEDTSSIYETILSDYTSINQIAALSSGTYTFKISEQGRINVKYPEGNVVDELEKVFKSVEIQTNELSNIFALHNTYIFELDKPKYFADLIGKVKLNIYADNDECIRVYEDYISSMYSVSKFKTEMLHYMHFFEDDVEMTDMENPEKSYDDLKDVSCFVLSNIDPNFNPLSTELSTVADENLSATNWMCIKIDDMQRSDEINYTVEHEVTEEEIKDFLKLYVNYRVDPENGETELYFNYNNYFCTPYSYRNSNGEFVPTYKDGTFLHLKSGETGLLNVIVQVKYYSHLGTVCAVKDIPILAYRIRNLSDDKPKFVIYRTWTLTPELVKSIQGLPVKDLSATLQIEDAYYGPKTSLPGGQLSSYMNEDFTINKDFTVHASYFVSTEDFGNTSFNVVYEYSNPEISFDAIGTKNSNLIGNFIENRGGNIEVETVIPEFIVSFTVHKGAVVDDETMQMYIPLDAINFKAMNSVGEEINHLQIIPGGITLDFGSPSSQYRFFGREKVPNIFNGFILGENGKVIRMYQNKARE